ncbi:hypothetical protein A3715_16540 [Oleiphilus sp. HI0009]|nr:MULTISPECIES: glucosaminidase domain-containing protein [unclassified Oleiphilus]KZX86210.1 hypothetical protein A3715_16540 [Oleiphilus sp. HI0009]KZY71166.1 hypothetical protein A3739_05600 [Oleiphilus sp. HI0067]KZZ57693.1 hypothetical protein A3762_09250 [Oleiphilus sp. HI0125]MCH2157337.1 glucosaminidase domain-containing protein [Oleiphilaceae bacterium]
MRQLIDKISFFYGLIALSVLWLVLAFFMGDETLDAPSIVSSPVPDFSSYKNVKEKKDAFFSYFLPIVEQENVRLEKLRSDIQTEKSQTELEQLAKKYRLEISSPITAPEKEQLLSRIDQIPSSLVLAQAAIESAWGTSRFATQGNNYFGQWCFTKGCGLVPSARNDGAIHEVRVFDSPTDSVHAYFRNINSHPTYAQLRDLRAQARANGEPIHGCVLAEGLSRYSERGQHYIDEIRQMIRVNKLTPHSLAPCRAGPKQGAE